VSFLIRAAAAAEYANGYRAQLWPLPTHLRTRSRSSRAFPSQQQEGLKGNLARSAYWAFATQIVDRFLPRADDVEGVLETVL